jgi:hypothetical protein
LGLQVSQRGVQLGGGHRDRRGGIGGFADQLAVLARRGCYCSVLSKNELGSA